MTPTISAAADNSINNNNNSPNAFHENQFQHHAFSHQDENNFPLQESAWPSAFRESSPSSGSINKEKKGPLSSANQQMVFSADAWKVSKGFDSPHTTMREPVAVSNAADHNARLALRTVDAQPNGFESPRSTRQEFLEESESAMAGRRGGRISADAVTQDSSRQPTMNDGARRNERAPTIRPQSNPLPTNPLPRKPASASPVNRAYKVQQTTRGDSQSVQSQTSGSVPPVPWEQSDDPEDEEHALFEQRLCADIYGVAVRKINQTGKSNLRYVKCCTVDVLELEMDSTGVSSSRSVSSRSRGFPGFRDRSGDRSVSSISRGFPRFRDRSVDRSESRETEAHRTLITGKKIRVLTWGKKKDVKIPLERFVTVRKGKTTDRTRRNVCPAARILSLITDDPKNPSLDIEAPTRLDRDKFARAFSRFLSIPLEGDDVRSQMTNESAKGLYLVDLQFKSSHAQNNGSHISLSLFVSPELKAAPQRSLSGAKQHSTASTQDANSLPFTTNSQATGGSRKKVPFPTTENTTDAPKHSGLPPMVSKSRPPPAASDPFDVLDPQIASLPSPTNASNTDLPFSKNHSSVRGQSTAGKTSERSLAGTPGVQVHHDDEGSVVSSITGAGFDQEIVEELHVALTELRAELEDSRAEAARAVKVAEQAIQSAENSNSTDWNSTVTHKAAEAAALAQKKSAEAMAKARMAEERLEGERKAALIWRKQAEAAEEEAGHWQTRAAAAEVQRAAMVESLESERKKAAALRTTAPKIPTSEDGKRDALDATLERNRALEFELEVMRQSLNKKMSEVTTLHECLAET
jgi:hypothetical protein